MSYLRLILATVSCASSNGSKLLPVQLSIDHGDDEKRHDDHGSLPNMPDNRSIDLTRAEVRRHPEAKASDSLLCMRWTGGTCTYLPCRSERGPDTECEGGYCVCRPGSCADAKGVCIPNFRGEWIEEYSIRFDKPFLPERPFLGVAEGSGALSGPTGAIEWLATVSTSDKQWKIAQTPNGRVRLTNTKHPGSVLAIYNNRRRSDFMQRHAQRQHKKIKDDDDLWPVLMKLEAATPLEATFQVRPTLKNGGGYELWDPGTQVSLASADPDGWSPGDSVVEQGVTECYHKSFWSSDPCDGGRQLVAFEPKLPNDALVGVARSNIEAISILSWWQAGFLVGCFLLCCICLMSDEDDPNSKPLIVHVVNAASTAAIQTRRARAEDAREAEVERERERNAFAEKIAGSWVLESDIGTFEYELWETSEGMSVRGRAQGTSQWDSTFSGEILAHSSTDEDTLCWKDDSGTTFTLEFENERCSGTASAVGGKQVSFVGKRAVLAS